MKFDIILHNFPPKIHPTKFNIALISRKKSRLISLNFPRTRVHFQLFINTTIDQTTIHPPTINLSIPYDTRETYLTPRITKTKKKEKTTTSIPLHPRVSPFPDSNHILSPSLPQTIHPSNFSTRVERARVVLGACTREHKPRYVGEYNGRTDGLWIDRGRRGALVGGAGGALEGGGGRGRNGVAG